MRTKFISIGSLIAASILFGGCMKVNVTQVIESDGTSHVEIVNDLSAIAGLGDLNQASLGGLGDAAADPAASDQLADFEQNLEAACDDYYRDTKLQNPSCERKDYVVTMAGDYDIPDTAFTVKKSIPYVTYTYDAKEVISTLGQTGGEQAKQFDEDALAQAKAGASLVGMELNYTVTMPGKEILTTDVGEISETKVEINIFDLIGSDETTIQSRNVNWLWIGILIVVGLVVLVVVVMILMMMMKKKRKAANVTPGLATTTKPFHIAETTTTSLPITPPEDSPKIK